MLSIDKIPVIDLFAGSGGLAEGFSTAVDSHNRMRFDVRLSVEKETVAHRTLSLRALYRAMCSSGASAPDCYYDYVSGKITREQLFRDSAVSDEARAAALGARCAELGVTPADQVDDWIREALGDASEWVLIGGPPCQAYSLAGRSRMRSSDPFKFERDKRHLLYEQYLRILRDFGPAVFVMENVKGILTSRLGGDLIFERILRDLQDPGNGQRYQIRSFVTGGQSLTPPDFLIESERFGLPQARHRVIVFGIRSDLAEKGKEMLVDEGRFLLKASDAKVTVSEALSGLPSLRSRLSREQDGLDEWLAVLRNSKRMLRGWHHPLRMRVEEIMARACVDAAQHRSYGGVFLRGEGCPVGAPEKLKIWLEDSRLPGVLQHEARKHMRSDLERYMFASSYAEVTKKSPRLFDFPERLLPLHSNVCDEKVPFMDRFRVQRADEPSTTIVSHIAKDGHYYIHPDPSQCRSLTVREAARLQTFPDNYFFEGNRTQQYWQVGNAVPPYLARQIADVVLDFLGGVQALASRERVACS